MVTPEERAFILELRELTMKHGIVVNACGCCGSPWLEKVTVDVQAGYAYGETTPLTWLTPADKNYIKFGSEIIRDDTHGNNT